MKRIASVAGLAVWLVAMAPDAAVQGIVDFSRPPARGLKFKVMERSREEGGTILKADDKVLLSEIGRGRKELVYIQTFVDVANGRIAGIERVYGKCRTWVDRKGGKKIEPQEHKHHITGTKVTWTPDSMLVEGHRGRKLVFGKSGKPPRLFNPERLRSPFLPNPGLAVSVGDSWQLEEKTLHDYYWTDLPGLTLISGKRPNGSWDFAYKLVRLTKLEGDECAVIQCKGRISSTEGAGPERHRGRQHRFNLILDATFHYSLRHCIVVAMDFQSSYEGFSSSIRKGKTTSREQSGTVRRTARVTVLEERKTP